jgi:hypothetical protein
MDDACPLCDTEVAATHRTGHPTEEDPNPVRREHGRCEQGHKVTRLLNDYGRAYGPWFAVRESSSAPLERAADRLCGTWRGS